MLIKLFIIVIKTDLKLLQFLLFLNKISIDSAAIWVHQSISSVKSNPFDSIVRFDDTFCPHIINAHLLAMMRMFEV